MTSLRRPDVAAWLAVAVVALVEAFRLGVGTPRQPGPGFLPALGGLALAGLALGLLLQPRTPPAAPPAPGGRRRLLLAVGALLAYALLFERLGFIVATCLVMWFLLSAVGEMRWPAGMGIAVGTAAAAWLIFDRALQAQLPRGVLAWFRP